MRDPQQVLNALCEHSKDSDYRYERLYRILFNEEMFFIAYQRKYANQGNMTPGSDGRTIDRMSIDRIQKIVASLRDESYKPHPVRRVYIPKKNGKNRPLGIPSFEDKLVQEVVHMILEAIYEGHFEDTSHGFRPNRSCHTALRDIKVTFKGTRWFIEGDIKGFYDNIDHNIMIDILRERISDERFLRLIRKFINAGYMEKWTYNNTYSGTPQGGIISPILANIYLDKFDKYIKEYAENFNKGKGRRLTCEYQRNRNQRNALRWKLEEETDENRKAELKSKIARLRKQMLDIPATKDMDNTFKRLKYVRYADDFKIFCRSYKDAVKTFEATKRWLKDRLGLDISPEKSKVINMEQRYSEFLGFKMKLYRKGKKYVVCSHMSDKAVAHAKEKISAAIKAIQIPADSQSQYIAIQQYNSVVAGLHNYYRLATRVSEDFPTVSSFSSMELSITSICFRQVLSPLSLSGKKN